MRRGGKAWRGWFLVGGELTDGVPDGKEGLYSGSEDPATDDRPLHGPNQFPARPARERASWRGWMPMTDAGPAPPAPHGRRAAASTRATSAPSSPPTPVRLFRIFHYPPERRGLGRRRAHRLRPAHDPRPGRHRRPRGAAGRRAGSTCRRTPSSFVLQPRRHARADDRRSLPVDPRTGSATPAPPRPAVVPVLPRPVVGRRGRAAAAARRRRAGPRTRARWDGADPLRLRRHLRRLPHRQGPAGVPRSCTGASRSAPTDDEGGVKRAAHDRRVALLRRHVRRRRPPPVLCEALIDLGPAARRLRPGHGRAGHRRAGRRRPGAAPSPSSAWCSSPCRPSARSTTPSPPTSAPSSPGGSRIASTTPATAPPAWPTSTTPPSPTGCRSPGTSTSAWPARASSSASPTSPAGSPAWPASVAQALLLFGYRWWAPFVVGGAWASTHHFLGQRRCGKAGSPTRRPSASAEPATPHQLAVERPRPRSRGCSGWPTGWSAGSRRSATPCSTSRGRSAGSSGGRSVGRSSSSPRPTSCLWSLASGCAAGHLAVGSLVVFAQAAIGTSGVPSARSTGGGGPAPSRCRSCSTWPPRWPGSATLPSGPATPPAGRPTSSGSTACGFAYPGTDRDVSTASTSPSRPAGPRHRRPERGRQDHPGQAAAPPVRPRRAARSSADGDRPAGARPRSTGGRASTAVFQDFVRYELSLRENVALAAAPRTTPSPPGSPAPGPRASPTSTPSLAKGYPGGTDLSGGQWQRVALAAARWPGAAGRRRRAARRADRPARRARARPRSSSGILAATRAAPPSSSRTASRPSAEADRICVLEDGPGRRARHATTS